MSQKLIRFYDAEEMRDRLTLKFPQLWRLIAEAYERGAFDFMTPKRPPPEPTPPWVWQIYGAAVVKPYAHGICMPYSI